MSRKYLLIFLLILLVIFLIFPQEVLAEIQLSKEDSHFLLNSVQQGLIDNWINITASSEFSQPEKQVALFLIRNAIQKEELNYALKDLPKDGLEGLIKIAVSLYLTPPAGVGEVLGKIEKETVKKAVEIATDWFLQNEIKVSSGKLNYSFTSYKGNRQEPVFYYNLAYHYVSDNQGELAVEFYSPKEIEPKESNCTIMLLPEASCWDFDTWKKRGNEKIQPFIIRMKGKVRQTIAGGYGWEETLKVEVIFPESMPEMPDLPEESVIGKIPFLGDYYLDWTSNVEKIMAVMDKLGVTGSIKNTGTNIQNIIQNIKNSAGSIINKTELYISQINPFSPASISQVPSLSESLILPPNSVELEKIEREIVNLKEKFTEAETQQIEKKSKETTLAEIQEEIDEITEKIDIINQKVAELTITKILDSEDEKEEEIEELKEKEGDGDKEEEVCMVNINTALKEELQKIIGIGPIIAQRIIEARPFHSLNDLIKVSGIGEKTLQNIINQSCAYVDEFYSGFSSVGVGVGVDVDVDVLKPSQPLLTSPEILITEIQIEGEESFYDFIELYNPATFSLDVSGFQLKKKTSTGKDYSVRVFPEGSVIPGQNYFLWANSEYASTAQILADVTSSQTLAKNNSIALFDKDGDVLDMIAWGSSVDPFVENSPFSQNPEKNQSLGRKWDEIDQKYSDANDNQEDFEIQIPTPRGKNQSIQLSQNQLPTAQIFYLPVNPTINQDIIFDASSSTDPDNGIIGYIWDFGDGIISTSTEATTTHSYSSSSDFLVILTVFDNDNATNSATTTITISDLETPTLEVVINEIAWMGTKASDDDEWIELYNNTNSAIDISGWTLRAVDGTPSVTFSTSAGATIISANGFYLLERTDDQTISDIGADQIYTGAMGNNGEKLELRDAENNLIDIIDCSAGWFAGRNQKIGENWVRMSMERINLEVQGNDSSNWITNNGFAINGHDFENNLIQGTPKARNSSYNFSYNFLTSPFIFQDTILTQEWGSYIIRGLLTIPENVTLFIEPGLKIEFVSEYYFSSGIEIKGTLKAIGGEGSPIIFTSEGDSFSGGWGILRFLGSGSILDNVVVKYGGYYRFFWLAPPVAQGAVIIENTDIVIKNSIIEDNLVAGVWLSNSNSLIENTIFRNNNRGYGYEPRGPGPGNGITVAIFLGGSSSPVLNNLTFEGNAVNIYPTP